MTLEYDKTVEQRRSPFGFENLRVRSRLILFFLVTTVGLLATGFFSLQKLHDNLSTERQEKIRSLVEAAHATVAHYERLYSRNSVMSHSGNRQISTESER